MKAIRDTKQVAQNIYFRNEIAKAFPYAFYTINLPRANRIEVLKTFIDPEYDEEDRLNLGLLDSNDYLFFSSRGITFLKTQILKPDTSASDILTISCMTEVMTEIEKNRVRNNWEGTTDKSVVTSNARLNIHHISDGINFYRDFNPKFEDTLYLAMTELNEKFKPIEASIEIGSERNNIEMI